MPVRIATFNCENLLSRTALLNLVDTPEQVAKSTAAFKAAEQLQKILSKQHYTESDKAKILDLIKRGKGFFTVEEDHGQLLSGNKVKANGVRDWFGHIAFAQAEVKQEATDNTGKVIKALNADVLCTVEVEDRDVLGRFNSQVLGAKRFAHYMAVPGNDPRGINVGILSDLPLRSIRTHVDDMDGSSHVFSRDCAEYELALPSGASLWMLCNHFKSQGFGGKAANDARRKKQAQRVVQILAENFDLAHDLVVVAGDLNDVPNSDPLSPLLTVPELHNIIDTLPAGDRFTSVFGNQRSQIDYLLVSTPLKNALADLKIERRGMVRVAGHFPSVTNDADAASDHAAVVAEFNL